MKLKYLLSVIAIVAISKSSFAQYAKDAVRFSTAQTGSTSRVKAIGNAGTAIGGDLTSVGGNPAGLGFFTRSEVSVTPELDGSNINSNYLGKSNGTTKSSGNLNNVAAVFYTRLNTPRGTNKTKGWLSLNFGAGYSRTNNFDEKFYLNGTNTNNSINDYYASLANPNGFANGTLPAWAYEHGLIDLYGTTPPAYASNNVKPVSTQQTNSIDHTGGQSEVNLSLGANYSNKLYLGFGIGITDLRYTSTNQFIESGTISAFENGVGVNRNYNSLYFQNQSTKGSGFNAKFGLIYKILESVRIGATVTTPTFISVDDIYGEGLVTELSNGNQYESDPSSYSLSYTMRTPFKTTGGVSVFLGKYGFITGDVEYIDYSTTHIDDSDSFDASYDNAQIKANYRGVVNTRFGAEIRLPASFLIRGGYGILGSPLKTGGKSTNTVTGGLGYRFANYYIDAAYQHISGSEIILPYDIGTTSPSANVSKKNDNFFLTVGFRY